MTTARKTLIALLLCVSGTIACAPDRPLVESLDEGEWRPAPFALVSLRGQRGGASVTFVLRLEDPGGRSLVVEGMVEINPQARLVRGEWREQGVAGSRAGRVSDAVIDFFGGQGGRPSIGGDLTLSEGSTEAYRLHLPATLLTAG